MDAVILCEFPSDNSNARSWILDRVALLAIRGKAELKFVGTEQATSSRAAAETIAIRIAGVVRANAFFGNDLRFVGDRSIKERFRELLFVTSQTGGLRQWVGKLLEGPQRA